jgi:cytochrome b6-f complex iron-sulfur subunit
MASASSNDSNRRSFIRYLLVILSGIGAVLGGWGIGRFVIFTEGGARKREVGAGVLNSLQPGVPVHVPEAGAWLIKADASSSVLGLDDRCTHLGCRYKWHAENAVFECPCHGSEFDLHGAAKRGPATKPLQEFSLSPAKDDTFLLVEKT